MRKIKSYKQHINESLEDLWKTYISKINPDISGNIKIFINNIQNTENVVDTLKGYDKFTSDIINNSIKNIEDNISKEDIEDVQKIRKIGGEVASVFTSVEVFLDEISKRFEDVYSPSKVFVDAKTPLKEVFGYENVDDFSKNITENIIKILNVWCKDLELSDEGMEKIKDFQLFEAQEEENVLISQMTQKVSDLFQYMKEYSYKKLQEIYNG